MLESGFYFTKTLSAAELISVSCQLLIISHFVLIRVVQHFDFCNFCHLRPKHALFWSFLAILSQSMERVSGYMQVAHVQTYNIDCSSLSLLFWPDGPFQAQKMVYLGHFWSFWGHFWNKQQSTRYLPFFKAYDTYCSSLKLTFWSSKPKLDTNTMQSIEF